MQETQWAAFKMDNQQRPIAQHREIYKRYVADWMGAVLREDG